MRASTITKAINRDAPEVVQIVENNMQSGTAENSMELRRRTGGDMREGIDYAFAW